MKSYSKLLAGVTLAYGVLVASQASATLTLIDENFASGTATGLTWTSSAAGPSNGQQWIWSSPDASTTVTSTEVWTGTGGASARGLATTYDHDQNGGTANINIPGGFEVMSSFTIGNPDIIRVAVDFVLPTNAATIGSDNGVLSFFVANRISSGFGGNVPRFELFNVTDNRSIVPLTALNYPLGNAAWNFKFSNLDFLASDLGDTLQLRFQESITSGASGGARGLQVADVTLSVTTIPEPATASLALLGLGGLMLRRRRMA